MQSMKNFKVLYFLKKIFITLTCLSEPTLILLQQNYNQLMEYKAHFITKEINLTLHQRGERFSNVIQQHFKVLEKFSIYSTLISARILMLFSKILPRIIQFKMVTKFINTFHK